MRSEGFGVFIPCAGANDFHAARFLPCGGALGAGVRKRKTKTQMKTTIKTVNYEELAERWGVSEVTAKRRMKEHRGQPCGFTGTNNTAFAFGLAEVKRVESEHAAAQQRKLNRFAEAK